MQKPQQILISHCKESGINFIDFTKLFEEYLSAGEMINNQSTNIQYENSYKKYFLDEDHLTVPGHLFVAGKLFEYMKSRYLKKVKCIENLTRYQ